MVAASALDAEPSSGAPESPRTVVNTPSPHPTKSAGDETANVDAKHIVKREYFRTIDSTIGGGKVGKRFCEKPAAALRRGFTRGKRLLCHRKGRVAHLDRVPASEAGGSGFEPRRAHKNQVFGIIDEGCPSGRGGGVGAEITPRRWADQKTRTVLTMFLKVDGGFADGELPILAELLELLDAK